MKYVSCHHEQAASMATEAYARVRRGPGVTLVTSGPGGTNAITGVAGSWLDHVPQIVISGQVFTAQTITSHPGLRTLGVQEINIVDIVHPITKYAVMVMDALEIRYHLEKAFYLATHGRPGPVWIDIPANVQNARIDPNTLKRFDPKECELSLDSNLEEKVAQVVTLLRSAKRPLIHVGQGVRIAGAEDEFFNLISLCQVPFVTARNANDMSPESHALFVGRPGTYGQRGANFAVQTSDLYIAVGTRLSLAQTGYRANDYARNAKVVMVDIDQAELDKDTVNLHLKIQTDAKIFLQELIRQLSQVEMEPIRWEKWITQCKQWKEKYPVILPEYQENIGSVNSYYFIGVLSDVLTPNDIVVTDMGFAFQSTHQAFRVKKGQRVFTNCGLASMGWGLPAAIGACFGSGLKRTICIAGEGGLMMSIHEMATLMHHKIPVKLFVLNNGGYLTIKQTQDLGFDGRYMGCDEDTGLSFPNLMEIAEAHSFKAVRLNSHLKLKEQIEDIMNHDGPVFCEIMMDPNQMQAPRALNRRSSDGTIIQTALEDSYPFLNPNEIEENLSFIHRI